MRFRYTLFLTVSSLCISSLTWAQIAGFSRGNCVLQNGQQLDGTFQLRTATGQSSAILLYYDGKKEREFGPDEVRHCTLGRRSYIVGGNFVAPDDKGGIPVDRDFVEVLDTTGRVQLFRYEYEGYLTSSQSGYAVPMGGPGTTGGYVMRGGGGGPGYRRTDILLLRAGTSQPLVPYIPGPRAGLFTPAEEKIILTSVGATTAFFINDPVLQKRIETGKLSKGQLAAAVRTYNAGTRLKSKN